MWRSRVYLMILLITIIIQYWHAIAWLPVWKKNCSYSCIFIVVEVLEESFTRSIVIDWYRLKKQVLILWNYISLYLSSNKFCLQCIESMSWWVSENSYYILLKLGSWVYFMIENMNSIKSEAFLTFTRKIRPA